MNNIEHLKINFKKSVIIDYIKSWLNYFYKNLIF